MGVKLTKNARCVELPLFQFRRAPNTFSQLDSALREAKECLIQFREKGGPDGARYRICRGSFGGD